MSRIGEKVKATRIENGMSQKQLGKKLGVSEGFINELEMGRRVINEMLIKRISKALGKDINDISMSFEEEVLKVERVPTASIKSNTKKEVNDQWNDAFASVLKAVLVYDSSMTKVISKKQLPIISNKIEGHAQDKVFYIQIEDDSMIGFRIAEGDIAFAHFTNEIENNSICIIERGNERVIRQIKRLDSAKILLISNKSSLTTETVYVKDIKVIAKLDRLEIKL